MRSLLICGFLIQLSLSQALPESEGVGVFSYQDSTGNRYGGIYGLHDGHVVDTRGVFPPSFNPHALFNLDDFFPEYFRNFHNLLQEAFKTNFEHQRLALNAARKAFDLTSNQAGFMPNFPDRFSPFGGFSPMGNFGDIPDFGMPILGRNSAFAGTAAGPDFTHQVASISPANPMMRNVDKSTFTESRGGNPGYVGVSSSSYSSSSNVNGQEISSRSAETVVNKDGKITKYSVHS